MITFFLVQQVRWPMLRLTVGRQCKPCFISLHGRLSQKSVEKLQVRQTERGVLRRDAQHVGIVFSGIEQAVPIAWHAEIRGGRRWEIRLRKHGRLSSLWENPDTWRIGWGSYRTGDLSLQLRRRNDIGHAERAGGAVVQTPKEQIQYPILQVPGFLQLLQAQKTESGAVFG